MTIVALALGLLVGNLVAPGSGFSGEPDEAARADAEEQIGEAGGVGEGGLVGFITNDLLPNSFVQPFVENEILRIVVLGIVVAAAISASTSRWARCSSSRRRGRTWRSASRPRSPR